MTCDTVPWTYLLFIPAVPLGLLIGNKLYDWWHRE